MGDTFPDGYFYEDTVSRNVRLLREDIKRIAESLEDLTDSLEDLNKRVSKIEARHALDEYIYQATHKDDIDDDFSPMSDEDTKKLIQD